MAENAKSAISRSSDDVMCAKSSPGIKSGASELMDVKPAKEAVSVGGASTITMYALPLASVCFAMAFPAGSLNDVASLGVEELLEVLDVPPFPPR